MEIKVLTKEMKEINYNIGLKKGISIAFDFDGVIHKYREGWKDGSIYDEINIDMIKLMSVFMRCEIPVFIFSTRDSQQIKEWLDDKITTNTKIIDKDTLFYKDLENIGITKIKLPAQLYIDDRSYRYDINKPLIDVYSDLEKLKY